MKHLTSTFMPGALALSAVLLAGTTAWAGKNLDPAVHSRDASGKVKSLAGIATPRSSLPRSRDWTPPLLVAEYPSFDNWDLNKAGDRDSAGLAQFSIRLWEYDNRIPNYDRFAHDASGAPAGEWPYVLGLGDTATFVDGLGANFSERPGATTQSFGVTDSNGYVHRFSTQTNDGWEITYSKLDPAGNEIIPWTFISTGADPWNFYLQPVILSDDTVLVTWMRDTEDICALKSTDGGTTWSSIIVLHDQPTGSPQAACPKVVAGPDDSLHFIWRELNWSTYEEKLWYIKLNPDWTIAVGETIFFEGPCWYPFVSMDANESLHVTFAQTYDVSTEVIYTRLRGDLDLGGASSTDAQLTEVPEVVIAWSEIDPVHYPLNIVDGDGGVHVIYEQGQYGRNTDKSVYSVYLAPPPPACPWDFDGSLSVGIGDLNALLSNWGAPCPGAGCPFDYDESGSVGLGDLNAMLSNWGPCP
jgi:hypothetical protein